MEGKKRATKKAKQSKAKQAVIYLDPFSPIKPWEAGGRSGKTELSLQEIKHEMKTRSSYSILSSQAPISHSRPLIKWCPVSALKDEFWLCSCSLESKGAGGHLQDEERQAGLSQRDGVLETEGDGAEG